MSAMDFVGIAIVALMILFVIGKATRWALNVLFTIALGLALIVLAVCLPVILLVGGAKLAKSLYNKALSLRRRALSHGPV